MPLVLAEQRLGSASRHAPPVLQTYLSSAKVLTPQVSESRTPTRRPRCRSLRLLLLLTLGVGFAVPSEARAREGGALPGQAPSPSNDSIGRDSPQSRYNAGTDWRGGAQEKKKRLPVLPFAQALYEVMELSDWPEIQLSTSAPKERLSRLLRWGYYRLELVQLVLMAKKSLKPLEDLLKMREKEKRLSEIAAELKQDYAALYDQALLLKQEIEDRMPAIVEVSTETAKEATKETAATEATSNHNAD